MSERAASRGGCERALPFFLTKKADLLDFNI